VPRWAFEKFPGTSGVLGTQMQSVGEAMAIGRTIAESLQKALRSLETGRLGLNADPAERAYADLSDADLLGMIAIPTPDRLFQVGECLRRGIDTQRIHEACHIDQWFLDQMGAITDARTAIETRDPASLSRREWLRLKRIGFADAQLAHLWSIGRADVERLRREHGVVPTYKVIILGSGPNRIGQGIEFDYCCVHASFALRDAGFETVMVNCNPETVSTDYDTSDRLYFEPLTEEDVLNVIESETKSAGRPPKVIVSLGGQTPLKLAGRIPESLIAGTSPHSIDLAEDREKWNALCAELRIPQPPGGTATEIDDARHIAERVGYPVLVRPSYVLGGRAMQIVHDQDHLDRAMRELAESGSLGREGGLSSERPVLIDRFLDDAVEIDVDALRDGTGEVLIGGVMEHVEQAGIHSGDSACVIPPYGLDASVIETVMSYTRAIANSLGVIGLLNVQYAVHGSTVYVIEANPRASRTVPFVAKATGVPLVKVATRVMLGATLEDLRKEGLLTPPVSGGHVSVKEAVLPFSRFPEVDTALGPEMRSTGEVMGIADTFASAFLKAETAAGTHLPSSGMVFLSLNDRDKPSGLVVAKRLREIGLGIVATRGTADYLRRFGYPVDREVSKVSERGTTAVDDAVELIMKGEIAFVINTPRGGGAQSDGEAIRKAANLCHVSAVTTIKAAMAAVQGLYEQRGNPLSVKSLQEYHQR
jgi:carbamoyl-phosphate synthase large subunit